MLENSGRGEKNLQMTAQKRQLRFWLLVLLGIVGIGVFSMHFFLGLSWLDSLFYTITTLATVGYGEPPGLDLGGKAFLCAFMFFGIGAMGIALAKVAEYFVTGSVLEIMGKRRGHTLGKLSNHWIICGAGRMGQRTAERFQEAGIPFVIIDLAENIESIKDNVGWLLLPGNSTDETILLEAGIDRAKGLVTCQEADADNIYTTLTARARRKDLQIVARASNDQSRTALARAGAGSIVNPIETGATALAWAALKPSTSAFFDVNDVREHFGLEIEVVSVTSDNALAGLSISQTGLVEKLHALILAILHDDASSPMKESGKKTKSHHRNISYNPPLDTTLHIGDKLLILCPREKSAQLHSFVADRRSSTE